MLLHQCVIDRCQAIIYTQNLKYNRSLAANPAKLTSYLGNKNKNLRLTKIVKH